MIGLLRAGRWPLFLRIFGLMLLTLLLVQVLNLALVLLVPPPQPAVTTIDHVVVALRDARPTDKLRVG
jgi:hypothetical protein